MKKTPDSRGGMGEAQLDIGPFNINILAPGLWALWAHLGPLTQSATRRPSLDPTQISTSVTKKYESPEREDA